jgi:hypothetical protein
MLSSKMRLENAYRKRPSRRQSFLFTIKLVVVIQKKPLLHWLPAL